MIGEHPSGVLLSEFINLSPQAICITTMSDIRFVEVNSNFEKFIGLGRDQIINKKLTELNIKFSSEWVDKILEEAMAFGRIVHKETEIELPGTGKRAVIVTSHIIQIENEKCLITFADDITEIRKVKEEHEETFQYVKMFFEQALEGIFFFEIEEPVVWNEFSNKDKLIDLVFSKAKIVDANDAFLNQYGMKREEVLGMTPSDFFSHDLEHGKKVWRDFFDKGRLHTETTEVRKDGTLIHIEGDYICLYDSTGRITGNFGIQRDVTINKQSEEALRESEERFRLLFENNHTVILLVDSESGNIIDANIAATLFYGYSHEEIIKLNINVINMLPLESLKNEMYKAASNEKRRFQFKHRLKSGEIRDVEVYSGGFLQDGRTILYSIVHDVTEYKKNEDLLSKLSSAVSQSSASVLITDSNGLVEYVNPAFTAITGYSFEEIRGKTPSFINSGVQNDDFYNQLWKTISSGQTWHGEIANKKKNNEIFWERETISPIENASGEITNFVAIKDDITKEKQLIQDLINAKETAEESDRLKSTFLATMSHELRTPLNAIIGFSDLLMDDIPKEDIDSFASTINKSGKHLLGLIEEIFDISLIETGQIKLHNEVYDATDILNDVFAVISREQAMMNKQHIRLIVKHPDNQSPQHIKISTDIKRLKQILVNLLKNALKFTDHGTIEYGYTIVIINGQENLKFFVSDTGIGIAKDKQEIIFDQFRQVDDSLTRTYGGTGLGLSICRKLLQKMGGEIWVESEQDKGSIFYFNLPVGIELQQKAKTGIIIMDEPIIDFSGKILLLAEDDDPSYLLLKAILKKTGIEIIRAKNGVEAVKFALEREDINMILMDINMPEMNGLDATRLIKEKKPHLPIIAQTAYSISGDKEKTLEAGCDNYISKPIRKAELFSMIEKYS
ncbi:MAG: hypothetical protein CVT93_00385 [Bacteroidetes bacterium HGW-Bacteroidetes-10]|nr:MAG: hypothetical protein CVT93_00385 [Bacteroidetes bacterium HGW-Bacteroidetes-10]